MGRVAVMGVDIDALENELEFLAGRAADPRVRIAASRACLAIAQLRSRAANLSTERDWWKTRAIRSEPMDPKIVDHLPAIR